MTKEHHLHDWLRAGFPCLLHAIRMRTATDDPLPLTLVVHLYMTEILLMR